MPTIACRSVFFLCLFLTSSLLAGQPAPQTGNSSELQKSRRNVDSDSPGENDKSRTVQQTPLVQTQTKTPPKAANKKPIDSNSAAESNASRGSRATTETTISKGGATHQTATGDQPVLTTQQGIPVADNQNSLKAGSRGPVLIEDFHLREKLFHFDHERIPERVVHARGFGVHGYFENYESLTDITSADLFQRAGEKTPAFVRFSTVAGNKGSPDLARDVRGFAVKLYTKEGNWDIVGNNIPVFFIQDAIKFPDLVHAAKQEPDRGFPQAQTAHDNFWDFISLSPESMHMVMWIM